MPLVIWRMSPGRAPNTEMRTDCSPLVPPVSTPFAGETAPGTSASRPPTLRLVGSTDSVSWVTTVPFDTLRTSTSGVPPETVIVSVRAPTASSALTVATKFDESSSPSRLKVENP
jgi:hypothetical protein